MKALFFLLFVPLMATAETASFFDSLKSEPATMFDIGMMRLERLADDFERRVGMHWTAADGSLTQAGADVGVTYSAADDKVTVYFFVMNGMATEAQLKEGCTESMQQMSYWLGKELPRVFLHRGAEVTQEQFDGLKDRFVLQCYVSSDRDSSVGRFWARRSLTDPTLNLEPWK